MDLPTECVEAAVLRWTEEVCFPPVLDLALECEDRAKAETTLDLRLEIGRDAVLLLPERVEICEEERLPCLIVLEW